MSNPSDISTSTNDEAARQLRETMRCPTCRAVQPWSETCRRCQSDLGLLREVAEARQHHRRQCLQELAAGHPFEARYHARRCHQLHPDAKSKRLLALCSLYSGDWPTAITLARNTHG